MDEPRKALDLADIRNSLTSLMWRNVGVRRSAERHGQALEMIDRWCRYVLVRQFSEPHGWELQNMLTVARLIVRSALTREESRGVHLRTDFPDDGQPAVESTPVRAGPRPAGLSVTAEVSRQAAPQSWGQPPMPGLGNLVDVRLNTLSLQPKLTYPSAH